MTQFVKHTCLFFLLFCSRPILQSQIDTIFSGTDTILCSVVEVGSQTISYTVPEYKGSPLFVMLLKNVNAYRLGTQGKVVLKPMNNFARQVKKWSAPDKLIIKTNPIAPLNDYISFAFEQSISHLFSVEFEGGYFDSRILGGFGFSNQTLNTVNLKPAPFKGGFLRPSLKLKHLDYISQKRFNMYYLRFDVAIATNRFYDVTTNYNPQNNLTSDITIKSTALILNFGDQFCWRSGFVLDFFLGVGISDFDYEIANREGFTKPPNYAGTKEYLQDVSKNFHCFQRVGTNGLTYAGGIRIGYCFSDK